MPAQSAFLRSAIERAVRQRIREAGGARGFYERVIAEASRRAGISEATGHRYVTEVLSRREAAGIVGNFALWQLTRRDQSAAVAAARRASARMDREQNAATLQRLRIPDYQTFRTISGVFLDRITAQAGRQAAELVVGRASAGPTIRTPAPSLTAAPSSQGSWRGGQPSFDRLAMEPALRQSLSSIIRTFQRTLLVNGVKVWEYRLGMSLAINREIDKYFRAIAVASVLDAYYLALDRLKLGPVDLEYYVRVNGDQIIANEYSGDQASLNQVPDPYPLESLSDSSKGVSYDCFSTIFRKHWPNHAEQGEGYQDALSQTQSYLDSLLRTLRLEL